MTGAGAVWTTALVTWMLITAGEIGAQAGANTPLRSTRSGVFTADQAALGRDVYLGTCRGCHSAPEHTPAFRVQWAGRSLWELFSYISDEMPKNSAGSLSPEEYAQVLAFTLQALGMPPGKEALPTDSAALMNIRLDTLITTSGPKEKTP